MNSQLKQRLVGAIVLVALAVIFVPMLLDGDSDSSMPAFGSNIPPKPGYHFEPLDIPPVERAQMAPKPAVIEREGAAPVKLGPVAEVEAQTEQSAPEGGSAGAATGWAVQVGSFSSAKNALALRDRLRSKGFDSFVEQVKSEGDSVYRVRVGPEASRERAEALKQRITAKEPKLPALVMSHP